MANDDKYRELIASLPDAAVWITGKWMKKLLTLLLGDRIKVDDTLKETPGAYGRSIGINPDMIASLPEGVAGDILYYDGDLEKWTRLAAPTVDSILVFAADADAPSWQALDDCP